jgi:hypothetical protein
MPSECYGMRFRSRGVLSMGMPPIRASCQNSDRKLTTRKSHLNHTTAKETLLLELCAMAMPRVGVSEPGPWLLTPGSLAALYRMYIDTRAHTRETGFSHRVYLLDDVGLDAPAHLRKPSLFQAAHWYARCM